MMTTRGKWAVLAAFGVLLAAAGVILGFVGMSTHGVACGSAFSPAVFDQGFTLSSMFSANGNTSECAPLTAGAAWGAWLLIICGVIALAFGVPGAAGFDWTRKSSTTPTSPTDAAAPPVDTREADGGRPV